MNVGAHCARAPVLKVIVVNPRVEKTNVLLKKERTKINNTDIKFKRDIPTIHIQGFPPYWPNLFAIKIRYCILHFGY